MTQHRIDREGEAVTAYLRGLAREPQQASLPKAAELYRRARLLERLFGEPAPVRHAMRRLALADVLGVLLAGSALLLSLGWAGASLVEPLASWSLPVPWLGSGPVGAALLALLGLGAALSFALAMWPLLAAAEE